MGWFDELVDQVTGKKPPSHNNNPLQDTWNFVTNAYEESLAPGLPDLYKKATQGPGQPIKAASAAPTLGDAEAPVIKQQLTSEKQAAAASSILTGGAGLLDQPTTFSRTLLGS